MRATKAELALAIGAQKAQIDAQKAEIAELRAQLTKLQADARRSVPVTNSMKSAIDAFFTNNPGRKSVAPSELRALGYLPEAA